MMSVDQPVRALVVAVEPRGDDEMSPTITARDRAVLLAAALTRVDDAALRAGMDALSTRTDIPRAVVNAMAALRRRGPVASAVGRPQYRAVLPYLATAVSEDCLAQTIEALGDHADDPSKEQLLEALGSVGESHSDATIAVMLASVAVSDMAASDLCFEVVTGDDRFGLADLALASAEDGGATSVAAEDAVRPETDENTSASSGISAEQRAARRERRREAAEQRRRRQEATQRAEERVRSRRKQSRAAASPALDRSSPSPSPSETERAVPSLVRRPTLTPSELKEFDAGDPLVGALVFVWVPFTVDDEERNSGDGLDGQGPAGSDGGPNEGGNGKRRPCVVIAVAPDQLLVKPCYSEGGRKGRDWTSVPVREWRRAGLDQPTWIGAETIRLTRPTTLQSLGRLTVADWNALW